MHIIIFFIIVLKKNHDVLDLLGGLQLAERHVLFYLLLQQFLVSKDQKQGQGALVLQRVEEVLLRFRLINGVLGSETEPLFEVEIEIDEEVNYSFDDSLILFGIESEQGLIGHKTVGDNTYA